MDCFVACAPRNDVDRVPHTTSSSRREAPELCIYLSPKEGVGNAGCPLHPRPRVHLCSGRTHTSNNEYTATPGIPARNGFNGFLRALLGDRACLPPSPADIASLRPVGPTCHPRT